jgi:hypothetical protein
MRGQEKRIRGKTQRRFAWLRRFKFVRKMQCVACRKRPCAGKGHDGISWTVLWSSNCERGAVPRRSRLVVAKPPFLRKSQLEIVQRLIPGILQKIVRFDSNARFWRGNKVNLNMLLLDRVPGPQRSNAGRCTQRKRRKKRRKRESRMESRVQNDSIVTGNASKKKLQIKNSRP